MAPQINLGNDRRISLLLTFVVVAPLLLFSHYVHAQVDTSVSQHFTLDGRLYVPGSDSEPLLDNNVQLLIQVLNPAKDCILYEEEQPVNTLGTNGYFTVRVGSALSDGKRTTRDRNNSMNSVFYNTDSLINGRTQANASCTYDPDPGAERFFRFFVKPSTAGAYVQLSDDMAINSVPQAIVAQTLQGLAPSDVFKTSLSSTQSKLDNLLTTEYSNITDLLSGASSHYLPNDPAGTVFLTRAADPVSPATGQIWFNSADNKFKYYDGATIQDVAGSGGATSHGALTDLTDDDHTQYALLAGRTTGQTLRGGADAGASLSLDSTSDATKGNILLHPTGGNVGIGTTVTGIMNASDTNYLTISRGNKLKAALEIYSSGNLANLTDSAKIDFIHESTTPAPRERNVARIVAQVGSNTTRGHLGFYTRGISGTLTQKMIIDQDGNVGIGTTVPNATLNVVGQIVSREAIVASGATANFALGNAQVLQSVGGATITVQNMQDGGQYTITIEDVTSRTYTFSGCSTSYFSPTNGPTQNRSVFTILKHSTGCYITWTTGFF